MFTEFNHSLINYTNTDIYVEPAHNRHQSDDFNITTLNFTWQVESYEEDTLAFKLDFYNPISISPLTVQDSLVIHFREDIRILFFSTELGRNLDEKYYTMKSKLKK